MNILRRIESDRHAARGLSANVAFAACCLDSLARVDSMVLVATSGVRIYRKTGGASVGYLSGEWGSGNLTGNGPDGLAIGPNGVLHAGIAFGTGEQQLLTFNTTMLSAGEIQTSQGDTNTGLTGLSTPRGLRAWHGTRATTGSSCQPM